MYRVSILLQPFSGQCVEDGYFSFGNDKMQCQVLSRIDRRQVETGYLYAFHAPEYEVEESKALLTQYYWEIFQIACLDVVREWLREYLQRKHSMYEKRFCSPAFGAGFYGMELSASEKMLQLMDAEKIGVSWDGGKMKPQMSVAGVYLISRKDILSDCRDCANCIGQQTGCAFCCNNPKK